MNWTLLIVMTIIGAIAYRIGGSSLHISNITKIRDAGLPSCMLIYMALAHHWNWWLLLCFGLMWGSQTSYFKFGQLDVKWWNWIICGLAFSFCMLPYSWATSQWLGFGLRTLVVTSFTVGWCEFVGNDVAEELGRGFIQIVTLPLLFI